MATGIIVQDREVEARVTASGRVMCGRRLNVSREACTGQFGYIAEVNLQHLPNLLSKCLGVRVDEIPESGIIHWLSLYPEGWSKGRDGIYTLSRHAQRQLRYGKMRHFRRPVIDAGGPVGYRHGFSESPDSYPARIRCPNPNCSWVNTLKSETLGVVAVNAHEMPGQQIHRH